MMHTPKFKNGDVVRVTNPDRYLVCFANKVRDRDGVVMNNEMFKNGSGRKGLIRVEFQKRNGRGKVFSEVLHEKDLELSCSE